MKTVFFRNDDLGWMPPQFLRLAELFRSQDAKLCAAAIPMSCLETYKPSPFRDYSKNLEVHVHGFTHLDFEGSGKKAEFGAARGANAASSDLVRGFEIISDLFPDCFSPVFTPPWNRIDPKLIPVLKDSGYRAISTDGPARFAGSGLQELNVTVDLHTNKKGRPSIDQILEYVESSSNPVGIMLHHKVMTDADFIELDELLKRLRQRDIRTSFMRELFQ